LQFKAEAIYFVSTVIYKMKKLLLLFCILPAAALAQKFSVDRPDDVLKQDPYTSIYFADNIDYKPVESIITISKNRYNNFRPDTLNAEYYNKNGFKTKSVRYYNNKLSTTTIFNYDTNGNLLSWHSFEKHSSTLAVYKYNKKKQLQETHKYTITPKNNKADTTKASRMLFKYDGDKLVQITNNSLGMDVIEKFSYEQNKLVAKTGGFVSRKFLYGNDSKPRGIIEYMGGSIDTTKFMGIEKFVYSQAGKLITDSVLTTSNIKTNTYQVIDYAYYENGMLRTINSNYKNFYRNVLFFYKNDKLDEIFLETNGNSAFLKFMIHPKIDEYYTFPLKYSEQFVYDDKGNRISKKVFVNNELFSEVEYVVTYR
jgi:hypothetical protein